MVAVVVGSHGNLSEEMIHTAEMIVGKQENIGYVEFFPGEGIDCLKKKYEEQFSRMDTADGILVLTDIFGGSPYNAAAGLAFSQNNMDVIAGTNVPMVIEACTGRENAALQCVIDSVLHVAGDSVQSFRNTVMSGENSEKEGEL